jgi:hypothetical protein
MLKVTIKPIIEYQVIKEGEDIHHDFICPDISNKKTIEEALACINHPLKEESRKQAIEKLRRCEEVILTSENDYRLLK